MRSKHANRWDQRDHPYSGRVAVLSTKHDKLPLVAPPLERMVGLSVTTIAVDTDVLGTFTEDIPRLGSPLDTAIAKARLGMNASGGVIGVASEGSIGPDPSFPFVTADRELVVLVDDEADIIVWESCIGQDIVASTTTVHPGDNLQRFLTQVDFPTHRLIVRPNETGVLPIRKGIDNIKHLTAAIVECASVSPDGCACIATDLRAHMCPSRQRIIAAAAERLAKRLAQRCPSCGAPGWGCVDVLLGVPCAWCGTEIARPRAEIDGCPACEHRTIRPIVTPNFRVDPGQCPRCNP
ncbi:DUF6671 family protein [Ferrimicrobium sp.]|uniref:DUF6671 family protein n=1 Tax=Ferrimicrobium sp. TaxID=2926050 RepID=UPI00260A6216|nr:DUF6671 family protein [Ferrimicrobium sp.]